MPSLPNYEKNFVFYLVGKVDLTQLKTSCPTCHFIASHGVEHFTKFFDLCLAVSRLATKAVKLFIVVIDDVLANGSQQAFLLANFMLTAALHIERIDLRHIFFLRMTTMMPPLCKCCNTAKHNDCHYDDGHEHGKSFQKFG